jgi:serine/threonine protein kinase/TolA-binding protein
VKAERINPKEPDASDSDLWEIRACSICGAKFPATSDFGPCPVCLLRGAGVDSAPAESANPISEPDTRETEAGTMVRRFDNYEVMLDDQGAPIELGRGAMGVTYKAFDVDLRIAVALKVISEKYVGDESARLRFLREARAAARVRHPNVASVFRLVKSSGEYFYAMEFVEGETLEVLIGRQGRLEIKPVLEIASQVAAGLSAVKEQSLVHRDIKPSNIMVRFREGGLITAKIIDLGLAKAVSESGSESVISTPGAFAGTPDFASPEQFAGLPVDIRSDLYSLGVTLWEMLTGRVPFRGSPPEVMHNHQHAPLPLEQLQGLPQPMVVLLGILLDKDPAQRFQSPAELIKALSLVTAAINAGRTLTPQQLRTTLSHELAEFQKKAAFPQRVKALFEKVRWAVFTAVFLMLSVVLSIWILERQQSSNEQLQALQVKFEKLQQGVGSFAEVQTKVLQEQPGQKPAEVEQRTYAALGRELGIDPAKLKEELPRFAQELKNAANATTSERANAAYVSKDYNESERLALAAADEAEHAKPPRNADAVKAFELAASSAEERVEYADALKHLREAERLTDRTRDAMEWARVQLGVIRILVDQGHSREAEGIAREVLKEREQALGPEDPQTLTARYWLARSLNTEGKYAEAEPEYRAVLKLREKRLGPEHPDTVATRISLGLVLYYQGKFAEAEAEDREVIRLDEKVFGSEHANTLTTRDNLAIALASQGKYGEAETEFRAVIKLQTKVLGPEHPDTLKSRSNLANLLWREGKYAESRTEYSAVLKLAEKVLGPEHPQTLMAGLGMAAALYAQGNYSQAETEYRKVLKLQEKVLGSENPYTLYTRAALGEALDQQAKYAEAEAEYRTVLQLRQKTLGTEHPDTLSSRNELAGLLDDQGKYAQAEAEHRAVLELKKKVLGPENPDTLGTRAGLGDVLGHEGKYLEAEAEYRAVLQLREKVLGPNHPDTLLARNGLAVALNYQGKYGEAEAEERSVLDIEQKVGPEQPATLEARTHLANALAHQNKYAEAETEYRATLKLEDGVLGPENVGTLRTRNGLAELLAREGKNAEAETEYRAVLQLREKVLGPEHPETLKTRFDLATCLRAQGNTEEASALAQQAADGARLILGPEHPDTKKYEQLRQELLAKNG